MSHFWINSAKIYLDVPQADQALTGSVYSKQSETGAQTLFIIVVYLFSHLKGKIHVRLSN